MSIPEIQKKLEALGYDPGPADGRWGPRSRAALKRFQRDRGLDTSGEPNTKTAAALGLAAGEP